MGGCSQNTIGYGCPIVSDFTINHFTNMCEYIWVLISSFQNENCIGQLDAKLNLDQLAKYREVGKALLCNQVTVVIEAEE